ncbi:MAG TPA: acyl-CoA dehydrogenase family protein [Ilumatobacteraceae bacterium]|nr:acyl-CoA dehydrogenase family protein [Ilumatobacteraceae bacterium]
MTPSVETDDEFRARVRDFLAVNADVEGWRRDRFGRAPDDGATNEVRLRRNRRCMTLLHEAGLGALSWPQRYGGQGLTKRHQVIFNQEVAPFSLPLTMFIIGQGMCGPTLLAYGTEEQRDRYLPPLLRGEEIWCQLFSEPGAGSDLASLRCRADRDGDSWVINGQKVWTSGAHNARFGLLLARSDAASMRNAGLTAFVVDMDNPGVDVRGLVEMTGVTRFNEVFFTDCRLAAGSVIGTVGEGWRCAITTLMNERVSIGTSSPGGYGFPSSVLIDEARRTRRLAEPVLRDEIARIVVEERLVEFLGMRVTEALLAGVEPGPEGSIAKLAGTRLSKRSAALAMEIVGPQAIAWDPAFPGGRTWADVTSAAPGLSIAGGTDEILRNILAERVLGLPRDARPETATASQLERTGADHER